MSLKDLGGLMKHAQELQEKMQGLQEEVRNLSVTGEAGAGMVRVVMNGRYEVQSVELDPSLLSEDKEVLEDLLAAACNDTVRKVEQAQQEKMSQLTGGLPLGGMPFGKMGF